MRYTYVRQHDTTDCAAACLAMVCLHYKKEVTITRPVSYTHLDVYKRQDLVGKLGKVFVCAALVVLDDPQQAIYDLERVKTFLRSVSFDDLHP